MVVAAKDTVVSNNLVPVAIRTALPAMLHILIKTFHGFHRNTIKYFQPRIHHKV